MASSKFQITLSEKIMEMLMDLCEKKGLSKSVIISLAIEQMKKGENNMDK